MKEPDSIPDNGDTTKKASHNDNARRFFGFSYGNTLESPEWFRVAYSIRQYRRGQRSPTHISARRKGVAV